MPKIFLSVALSVWLVIIYFVEKLLRFYSFLFCYFYGESNSLKDKFFGVS